MLPRCLLNLFCFLSLISIFPFKTYPLWQLSVHHESSSQLNKNMTHYATLGVNWHTGSRWRNPCILISFKRWAAFYPLWHFLATPDEFILVFKRVSRHVMRMLSLLMDTDKWRVVTLRAPSSRLMDGWCGRKEAECCTSRCHESILSHSPAAMDLCTAFAPQVPPCFFTKYIVTTIY